MVALSSVRGTGSTTEMAGASAIPLLLMIAISAVIERPQCVEVQV